MRLVLAALLLPGALVDTAGPAGIDIGDTSAFGAPCVADLNGDGIDDLVIDRHKAAAWDVYAGTADGAFVAMANPPGRKVDTHGCLAGDWDADGDVDLVGIKGACQGTCLKTDDLWLHRPAGWALVNDKLGAATYDRQRAGVVADLNGDGWLDYATAAAGSPTGSAHKWWMNRGLSETGEWQGFTGRKIAKASGDATCITAADVDGDGALDLLICQHAGLIVSHGPTFAGAEPVGIASVRDVEVLDLDDDGDLEWLVTTATTFEIRSDAATVLQSWPLLAGIDSTTVDLDGDRALEVFVAQALSAQPADGLGAHFVLDRDEVGQWQRVAVPQPSAGAGSRVVAVGSAVLVLNGGRDGITGKWDRKGPRQLITIEG